jgi:hypothetical protein
MEAGRNIILYRNRVEAEFGQMEGQFCFDLFENFEAIFSPRSNLFYLEFAPRDGLAKIKVRKRRLELREGGFYVCETRKNMNVEGCECSSRGGR